MMKKILFLLLLVGCGFFAKAQTNPFPTTDSLERFINRWIRNSPVEAFQNLRLNTSLIGMLRFIQNSEIGSGLDTAYKLNDSTIRLITHAPDTFDVTLRFTGGGTANANVGLGFRILKPGTQEIKTLFASNTILIDSSSNTDGLTIKVDTSAIATQYDLTQVSGTSSDTTYTLPPIEVRTGTSDTLALRYGYGLTTTAADTTLIVDTFSISTRAWRQKGIDSVAALIAGTTSGINQLTGDVTAGPGTGSQVATIANNAVTDAKLRQGAARSVIGRAANSTGNVADIASATANRALTDNGTSLDWRQIDLTNTVTGQLPEDNIGAFSPFPAERTYGKIYEKYFWNNTAEDLQVGAGTNTMAVSAGRIQLSSTTFQGTHIVNIIPGRISCLNKSKLTAQFTLDNLTSSSFELGLKVKSVITHSGANFGYMGFVQTTSSGTGSLFLYDEARSSSKATAVTGFTFAAGNEIELVLDLRDTVLVFTAQNLTTDPTGASKKTITYSFTPNSSAHILPNSYNWAIYDGNGAAGTRTLKYVKIESDDVQYPNLLILGNSKTKIGYATFWNGRFGMQLNSTYPSVVINAGGAERLSDMILRLDELTALSPSQVLLADIAANSLRAGVSVADVVTQYRYIVSRLEGAGIRVLHLILPEDSTAGGLGQTAWHARLSAEYPTTYISEVYEGMSTNNIADAGLIHADGVHLVQRGNDSVTAITIRSGKVQTISASRRSEIRTNDRWIVKTGDSLHFARKIFSRHNYVPRWDDVNQSLTTGVQFMDSTKSIFSMSSRATSPLTNAMVAVDGPIVAYGTTGSRYIYDRTITTNNYSEYVNGNTFNIGYNGTDVKYMGTDGRTRIGNGSVVSTLIPSAMQLKLNQTFTTLFARKGFQFSSDSVTLTYSGSGALGDRSINSFHKAQVAASGGATSYDTLATVHIEGAPYAGTNVVINYPLALEVMYGRSHFGAPISILHSPAGYGSYRIATINPDSTLGGVPSSTFATQSALNDTAAAIRAAGGGGGGLTSINSQTGPAISITASNGIGVATTTNTVTATLGGTLNTTTQILGAGNTFTLGTSGSKIGTFSLNASTVASIVSDSRINLLGNIAYQAESVTADANYTVPANAGIVELNTASLTTDRTVTLPTAATHGQVLTIVVRFASSGSHFNLSSGIENNASGSNITQLQWGTTYKLMVNASLAWMIIGIDN